MRFLILILSTVVAFTACTNSPKKYSDSTSDQAATFSYDSNRIFYSEEGYPHYDDLVLCSKGKIYLVEKNEWKNREIRVKANEVIFLKNGLGYFTSFERLISPFGYNTCKEWVAFSPKPNNHYIIASEAFWNRGFNSSSRFECHISIYQELDLNRYEKVITYNPGSIQCQK